MAKAIASERKISFGKKKTGFNDIKRQNEDEDNQEYLNSIKEKL